MTDELRRAGLVRAVTRLIQEARKAGGLDVGDRIALWWETDDPDLATALRENRVEVAAEVLATSWQEGPPRDDLPQHRNEEPSFTFWLRRDQ
jgi:isoleucyl-tRNA synthetase